jgi:hypothetical protein
MVLNSLHDYLFGFTTESTILLKVKGVKAQIIDR